MGNYFVYILANKSHSVLYIGLTHDISKRILQHKFHTPNSFTDRYNVNKLVYIERFEDIYEAKIRERSLKKWKRVWKNELISKQNPSWKDLSTEISLI